MAKAKKEVEEEMRQIEMNMDGFPGWSEYEYYCRGIEKAIAEFQLRPPVFLRKMSL